MQSPMPPRVLVSYRRADGPGFARMVYDRLEERFPERVFMDLDDIEPGTDFAARITESVRDAAVVVAVIGKNWTGSGAARRSRLLEAHDFVRLEIAMALDGGSRVIPVLLPAASLPSSEELPDELLPLLRLQALSLTDAHLQDDIDQLVGIIARHFGEDGDPVTLSGMPSNQGWIVMVQVRETELRGISVRIDQQGEFRSTGFEAARSTRTGLPMPRSHFPLSDDLASHDIDVKYIDSRGVERGPFRLRFDAPTELVRSTRDVLSMVRWIEFRAREDGRHIAYFTGLLSYKNAFREIRYSVDDERLERELEFSRVPNRALPGIDEGDQMMVDVPAGGRYVCVKLYYIDGSESELGTFPVSG